MSAKDRDRLRDATGAATSDSVLKALCSAYDTLADTCSPALSSSPVAGCFPPRYELVLLDINASSTSIQQAQAHAAGRFTANGWFGVVTCIIALQQLQGDWLLHKTVGSHLLLDAVNV